MGESSLTPFTDEERNIFLQNHTASDKVRIPGPPGPVAFAIFRPTLQTPKQQLLTPAVSWSPWLALSQALRQRQPGALRGPSGTRSLQSLVGVEGWSERIHRPELQIHAASTGTPPTLLLRQENTFK